MTEKLLGSAENLIHLLGHPAQALKTELGDPFAQYEYRGRDVMLFEHHMEILTAEVEEGLVSKIEAFEDRRSVVRIKPSGLKKAFIRQGKKLISATIIDLSVKSISAKIVSEEMLAEGDVVELCMSLKPRGKLRQYAVLAGYVFRVAGGNVVVIMIDTPAEAFSYKALVSYISSYQVMETINSAATPPPDVDTEETATGGCSNIPNKGSENRCAHAGY